MATSNAKSLALCAHPRQRVLSLLRRFGYSANSFQVLQDQFAYWFYGEDACVAYVDTGRAYVGAGSPIARADAYEQVALGFLEHARAQGRRVAFFGTESPFVRAVSFPSILVGTQPSFIARDWCDRSNIASDFHRQCRRARAKGLHVTRLSTSNATPEEFRTSHSELQHLMERWLKSKPLPPMGFLAQLQPFGFPAERRYLIARVAQRAVGFAVMTPIYGERGWLLESLVRSPDAPNGTIETLIDSAVTSVIDAGDEFVTLGVTPLAGDISASWLRAAKRLGAPLYNFAGLERFRGKFEPAVWSPIYITYAAEQTAPTAIFDCLIAFAHGSLMRFATQCGLHWLRKAVGQRWWLVELPSWLQAIACKSG
jgi:phosphatidylglycerol lysyltransferase